MTAEESELGWEVLRQAAALTASSHGQSSLTTRQLLHGACAGLRSISQEQMDFMVRSPAQVPCVVREECYTCPTSHWNFEMLQNLTQDELYKLGHV